MGNRFSSAKNSISECDRCGFRFKLKRLKRLVIKTKQIDMLVCPQCWEPDHPQLQLGMYPVDDPQGVRNPRPDRSYVASGPLADGFLGEGSRIIQWGWNPVGGGYTPIDGGTPNSLVSRTAVGTVTIEVDSESPLPPITQYALVIDPTPLGTTTLPRLAPIFWTVNFNSEMMAALVTSGADALTCTCLFRTAGDLAGIEFFSEDAINGASYSYVTNKNFLGLVFSFNYAISGNAIPVDDVNGAVLTVEGRDINGTPTVWYIRLWNYATGTGTNAAITLNFNTMQAGFFADQPFYGGDIDRMFISVIPIGYTGVTTPITETTATISITNMTVNQTMTVNESLTPVNDVRMSNGYDNVYNQTPASVVRQIQQSGCATLFDWYVGASHYYSLSWNGSAFVVDPAKLKLNQAATAWHIDFFNRLLAANITPIIAFSLEILTPNIPAAWAQRTYTGAISATGYFPITTSLISPCNSTGIQHMYDSYNYVLSLMPVGMTKYIQFGEWWWWCNITVPCYYDSSTTALYQAQTGLIAPTITSINNDWSFAAAFAQWCGDKLGIATDTVKAAVLAAYPGAQVSALIFPPQFHNIPGAYQINNKTVLEVTNLPVSYWQYPNLTWCQVEDYDWVTSNNTQDMQYTVDLAFTILNYPAAQIDYFAGFAVTIDMWPSIQNALNMWAGLNINELFLWSQIQVNRDDIKIFQYS
jgi:hypothetical protein